MTIAVIIINNDSLYKVGARDRKGGGDRKITQSENLAPTRHEMDAAAVRFREKPQQKAEFSREKTFLIKMGKVMK